MATTSLQAESAPASPAPLSLHSAAQVLEDLQDDLADLSALVWLAAKADGLDVPEAKALRAIMARLDGLSATAGTHSTAFLDASRAMRAAMQ